MMKKFVHIFWALSVAAVSAQAQDTAVKLSLQQCIDLSERGNVNVKNAELDILAAKARRQEALAEYFPSVSLSAFGFYALEPMLEIGVKDILGDNEIGNKVNDIVMEYAQKFGISPIYSTLQYGYSANVMAMQPVFAGGRIVTGNRLASLGVEAAALKKNITMRSNAEEVEKAYWQAVALEEKMQTLLQAGEMLDTLYRDVNTAVGAGLALDTDLMQVKMKQNEIRKGLVMVRNGIKLSKMNLLNMIGTGYSVISSLSTPEKPFIDDFLLSDRLDSLEAPQMYYTPEEEIAASLDETRLLELSVTAKKMEKRMTLGEALPSVAVGASYGYSHTVNERFNGNVFAMVKIPITDWGKVSRRMQRQEYEINKAENQREYLSAQLQLQLRQLWMNLVSAWDRLECDRYGVELAQKTEQRMMMQYEAGSVSLSELLQARTALNQAKDAFVDSSIAYKNALTEYLGRQKI